MDIYTLLSSKKPHNPHYINRYITFIEQCQQKNVGYKGYTEKHHICPKSDDMFVEYKNLNLHPWNCVALTKRQHFIAHLFLWKSFPNHKSQMFSAWLLMGRTKQKVYSKIYNKLKEEYVEHRYKTTLPKGMTREEMNLKIEMAKKAEKKLRKEKAEAKKKLKIEKAEAKKKLKTEKTEMENPKITCLYCRQEMTAKDIKLHQSVSFGNCSHRNGSTRPKDIGVWEFWRFEKVEWY